MIEDLDPAAYRQSTDYTCGPASLRIALKLLGIECSEEWLAKLMRTSSGVGTSPSAFGDVLRKLDVESAAWEDATIQDIERSVSRGLPVLVAWTLHGDGHYSVITGVSLNEFSLIEPFQGRMVKVNKSRFLRLWHDPCNQTTRWMMVVGEGRRRRSADESKSRGRTIQGRRHF